MIFDVMLKEGKNSRMKDIYNVYRVRDSELSKFLRDSQEKKYVIIGVIPLFRKKINNEKSERNEENISYSG